MTEQLLSTGLNPNQSIVIECEEITENTRWKLLTLFFTNRHALKVARVITPSIIKTGPYYCTVLKMTQTSSCELWLATWFYFITLYPWGFIIIWSRIILHWLFHWRYTKSITYITSLFITSIITQDHDLEILLRRNVIPYTLTYMNIMSR